MCAMGALRRLPAVLATATLAGLAACGSEASSSSATALLPGEPQVVIESPGTGPPARPTPSHVPGGASGSSSAQQSGIGAGGATPSHSASSTGGGVPGVGAAPGDYPTTISSSSNAPGAKPRPAHPGTLRVSAAQAGQGGYTQDEQSFDQDGNGLVFGTLIRPSGEIDLSSAGSENTSQGCALTLQFSPPIESVPARLAAGASWSGPVNAPPLSGSYTGSVSGSGTDTVAGTAVAIWHIRLILHLNGTVCGFQGTADITTDEDWAPSIALPVVLTSDSTVTIPFGTFHAVSSVRLQSLKPS